MKAIKTCRNVILKDVKAIMKLKAIRKSKATRKFCLDSKGALTTEAAIAFPVFICVVLSIVFLIKAVYTYETIQHALTETCDEIASMSYIYYKSGLMELDSSIQEGVKEKTNAYLGYLDVISSFGGNPADGGISGEAEEFGRAAELLAAGGYNLATDGYDKLKTELFTPLTKKIMKKYLDAGNGAGAHEKLKALNVDKGFEGLDFSGSSYFKGNRSEINLMVKYKINLPLPISFLGDFVVVQRAFAEAWTGGDEPHLNDSGNDEGDDIWSLDNFTRGRKIREIFGANLPFSFPVIAAFDSGTATMIKSMDITAASYSNSETIIETVGEYISALKNYKGQENPWGSGGIVILPQQIKEKVLLLVIPGNEISQEQQQALDECRSIAQSSGVTLTIKKYGIKKIN